MVAYDWTGTIPSFVAGSRAKASDLQTLSDILTAQTGASGTWAPTLTGLAIGTGGSALQVARYNRVNKRVPAYVYAAILGNSGFSVGAGPSITLPVAPAAYYGTTVPLGLCTYVDVSAGQRWEGIAVGTSGSTVQLYYATEAGGGSGANITNLLPFQWAAGDILVVTSFSQGYETT